MIPLLPTDAKSRQAFQQGVLIAIVLVGVCVFLPARYSGGLIGINDLRKEEAKLVKQVQELEKNLAADLAVLAREEKLIAERSKLAPKIEYYESRLPSTVGMPELLRELDAIANRHGLTFSMHDPVPPREQGAIMELPRKVELHSDYHGFGRFLNDLENAERFAKVDDVSLEFDKNNPGRHKVALTLSTFIFNKDKLNEKPAEEPKKPAGKKTATKATAHAN